MTTDERRPLISRETSVDNYSASPKPANVEKLSDNKVGLSPARFWILEPLISSTVTSDIVPLHHRGIFQGFGNLAFGAGMGQCARLF
ncbi:uncharacterized protein L201_001263 [Kwoniella dendrophila CBS 6074]|uniref:Uncharacterized protein n=1 Tax=Kwoniella dendrophila CBS 6074 TaxID=1295534 RepID=A0AAX4JLV9_9TREE